VYLWPITVILTAAHCTNFTCEGWMVLGQYYIEEIETTAGKFKVTPVAIEPMSDIAVLGALDGQTFPDEEEQFEEFCAHVAPVPICRKDFELFQEFPVYIHTHKRTWIEAEAQLCRPGGEMLWIEASQQIESGTSGGPVVTGAGELLGIVSHASIMTEGVPESMGRIPRPHLTLPVWVWRRIVSAEQEE